MKNVLIIGATSAIAQEVAKTFAKRNFRLYLIGRNSLTLNIISEDLKVRGARQVHSASYDLNDLKSHTTLINDAYNVLQKFDIVLLAHGILGDQRKAEVDQDELLNILNSNFISHASLLGLIAEKMKLQGDGIIAVISSVAGDRGKQSNYVYGSAKAGKTVFTDGLRNRLFDFGVHVLNIKLGFVDTPMTKEFKKGPLWVSAPSIAEGIVTAIDKKKDTVYLPSFWKFIMLIIMLVPEKIFKQLKL